MRELFVYYRVRSDNAAAAHAAVQRLHAQLRYDDPHLSARLLRRPEEENGLQTWMETYAAESGITDAMQARIETSALALLPLIDGSRHTEVFLACGSSAGPPLAGPHPLGGSANVPDRRGAPPPCAS